MTGRLRTFHAIESLEAAMPEPRRWQDVPLDEAVDLDLSVRLDITAPLNEMGERCPWPWDPQQLLGQPLGQYHCEYCGAMVIAGIPHLDYTEDGRN